MTPFVYFYLIFSLVVFLLAWLKCGHTQRAGVALCKAANLISYFVRPMRIEEVRVGEALCDIAVLAAFGWLAFRGNRWWPVAATAVMILTVAVHMAVMLVPVLTSSGDVSARLGLGVMLLICLLAGVGERWLAGESPVSGRARWRSVRIT
jgi:hypothetical protein